MVFGLLFVTYLGPHWFDTCGEFMQDIDEPAFMNRRSVTKRQSSGAEDVHGTGMDVGAVAIDIKRKESHLERTTGERKVDGLEHRLSNELA
jgi:hypothetical protein